MTTELQMLKKKCLTTKGVRKQNASKADLARMKQLQDAEPLSQADIDTAAQREEEQKEKDISDFKSRQQEKSDSTGSDIETNPNPELDKPQPVEHHRITTLKNALLPFSQIQQDPGRDASTVLIVRGVSITAGDVRKAIEAMKV